ncbi:hypothetical protein BJV78DRAFT_1242765 [Lactifluus subvellereus]|nr:hypothetical protein BJV78DRAFT_1242765 [Lactifluus subvellereus]
MWRSTPRFGSFGWSSGCTRPRSLWYMRCIDTSAVGRQRSKRAKCSAVYGRACCMVSMMFLTSSATFWSVCDVDAAAAGRRWSRKSSGARTSTKEGTMCSENSSTSPICFRHVCTPLSYASLSRKRSNWECCVRGVMFLWVC